MSVFAEWAGSSRLSSVRRFRLKDIRYPARIETLGLLQSTGIAALADELGIVVADSDVDRGKGWNACL